MDKLLVTGISGFLGWHLANAALEKYKVYGTVHSNLPNTISINKTKCNLANTDEVYKMINNIKPDYIIHAAAISQPVACEQNTEYSSLVNTNASVNLAKICNKHSIPFIFTSSDMVFDGDTPPYTEQSIKYPKNIYGKQKSDAEEKISNLYPEAAICRMPLMFGLRSPFSQSFIQPIIENLKKGIKTAYFNDEYRTPISAWDVSDFFLNHINNLAGLFNLGGNERVSRYDFALKVAEIGGYPSDLIQGNSQKDVQLLAPRPKDLTMDNSRAKQYGFSPKSISESLKILKDKGGL